MSVITRKGKRCDMSKLNAMEDFRRSIDYRLLKQDDQTIRLTGTILDRFHDIEVVVLVAIATMTITDTTMVFRRAPTGDCNNVCRRIPQLVGLVIGPGMSRALQNVLGGIQGCGNVRNLLLGLLPLALNMRAAAGITDERCMLDTIHEELLGTCAGYANPVVRQHQHYGNMKLSAEQINMAEVRL